MFYETAQTVGPGWHSRSYKPAHYEEMSWSPSSRHFRSPGSSPETYRRIIHEDDFPNSRNKSMDNDEDDFFVGRRSPTLSRRIFKEVWNDSTNQPRFSSDRPRMFKKVFRPNQWEDEFDRDVQSARRVERDFDRDFPTHRDSFGDGARFDMKRDFENEFQKAAGKVHHIPIMVERRMEEMKSKFGKPSSPPASERAPEADIDSEEWVGPQVHNLRKNFEQDKEFGRHRSENGYKPRAFTSPVLNDTWDPHSVHTLPTRRSHRSSQNFDDSSRHAVPPKPVFRSYSETHEDMPKPQAHHSAAFRSHSDGHCPKQTYVTKIEVNGPTDKERDEMRARYAHNMSDQERKVPEDQQESESMEDHIPRSRSGKFAGESSPSMQQINVVMQNVEDLLKWVEAYNGTGRDKHFRFLDEMLTRCMLRLDDVDTEGREDIRSARKAAVRQVQTCIEKLEAKADESERRNQRSQEVPIENEKQEFNNDVPDEPVESTASSQEAEQLTDDLKLPAVIPLPPPTSSTNSEKSEAMSNPTQKDEAIEESASNSNDDEQTKL